MADKDISKYDTVILVYPCWWGTLPRPMFTFITSHSFAGKKVCPICTHEGSGMGGSEVDLKRLCTGATLVKGLAVQGSYADNCDSALDGWLKTL